MINNNDPKKEAKEKFKKIVDVEVDAMLGKTLSPDEIKDGVRGEVAQILREMTFVNRVSADIKNGMDETLDSINSAKSKIADEEKKATIREELDKAA